MVALIWKSNFIIAHNFEFSPIFVKSQYFFIKINLLQHSWVRPDVGADEVQPVWGDELREDVPSHALPLRLWETGQEGPPRHGQGEATLLPVRCHVARWNISKYFNWSFLRFGELFLNWRLDDSMLSLICYEHPLCRGGFCLWTKEWPS